MIEGVGIDNVEVARMKNLIDKNNLFRDRVFTPQEIEYCMSQNNYAQSFAARFAAKEAFAKALGTGFIGNLDFRQIEVCKDNLGKPYLSLSGEASLLAQNKNIATIHLSLTHTSSIASAVVILEKL